MLERAVKRQARWLTDREECERLLAVLARMEKYDRFGPKRVREFADRLRDEMKEAA